MLSLISVFRIIAPPNSRVAASALVGRDPLDAYRVNKNVLVDMSNQHLQLRWLPRPHLLTVVVAASAAELVLSITLTTEPEPHQLHLRTPAALTLSVQL